MRGLIEKITNNTAEEKDWYSYFIEKDSELETEYANLTSGTKTKGGKNYRRVGYNKLRDFYDGDQWSYNPEGGQKTRVFNFCRLIADNYTAFMTNESIEVDIPPKDITDEIEVARAEAKEKIIDDIFEDNKFFLHYEAGVLNGSVLGDTILLGPFYNEAEDKISFQNIRKPENVRLIWTDDSYSDIFGFIHHYYISEEKAYSLYGDLIAKNEIVVEKVNPTMESSESSYNQSSRLMVKILDCWTAKIHLLIVGNKVLKFEEHNWGFAPIMYIANLVHPEEPFGISDLEDVLDAQTDFNEKTSELSEIISNTAYPYIFGKNFRPTEIQSGKINLIDMGEEAEFMPDPRVKRTDDLNAEINRRNSTIYQLSGLNENIFGGAGVRAVTGRALSVLMQTVNNRIKGRQERWGLALKKFIANIFVLIEKYIPRGKDLIGGYYKADIFFPGTLLRNITDEINKFNAKLQSQETTMKNLGVPSPKDEKKLMMKELSNEMLMIEISRNPALQLQIVQMKEQQLAQKTAGVNPLISEDQNMTEQPAAAGGAAQQSAQSPEGAMRQAMFRNKSSLPIQPKE